MVTMLYNTSWSQNKNKKLVPTLKNDKSYAVLSSKEWITDTFT